MKLSWQHSYISKMPITRQWLKWSARSGGLPSPPLPVSFPSTPLPFPFPSPSSPLPSLSPLLPLEVKPPIAVRGSGGALELPQRGLERSPSQNWIWCILALKSDNWWQQIWWFSWEQNDRISCIMSTFYAEFWNMVDVVSSVYYGHNDKLKIVTHYTHRLFTVTKLKESIALKKSHNINVLL